MTAARISSPKRGELWLVELDPTLGSEIAKTRPGLVISVDSMSDLDIKTIVPITEWKKHKERYFTRVTIPATVANGLTKDSAADAAQIRTLSLWRFKRRIGVVTSAQLEDVASAVAIAIGAA